MTRNTQAAQNAPLVLAGQELELLAVSLDGKTLSKEAYSQDDESLKVFSLPAAFSA